MARAPRSAVWTGVVMGVGAVVAAWFVGPRLSGRGGVEVVGPLDRSVEVATVDGAGRHVTLWLWAEVRESAVFEVYREATRTMVKVGGDMEGLEARSVNEAIEGMMRDESVTRPALERVAAPRLAGGSAEAEARTVRWRPGGVAQNIAALGATGLGFGMLGFGVVSIVVRATAR